LLRLTKIKINKKFSQSLNFSPMQVKGVIGMGRKRRCDDNYTCNGEEDGAKLNQMMEKDGQIKAKEESNR
jgi:hypothetical protein